MTYIYYPWAGEQQCPGSATLRNEAPPLRRGKAIAQPYARLSTD